MEQDRKAAGAARGDKAVVSMLRLVGAITLAAFSAAMAVPALAQAQSWPSRPVRVVVPFPPGGPADVMARITSAKFTEAFGQQFVIDNRAGANGNIGASLTAKAANDGYTIMFATTGPIALNYLIYKNTPYDPTRDFAPVVLFGDVPMIVVANLSAPVKSVQELIAHGRANPGKLVYGSPGHASMGHLVAELLQRSAGVKFTHVPYKGSAPAMADLMGGSISIAFDLATSYIQHIKTGRVRGLAISTATRFPDLPDVPTISEGGIPGYQAAGWFGIVGPAGMPREAVTKMNSIANAYLASPEGIAKLREFGTRPIGGPAEDLAKFVRSEVEKWKPVIAPIAATLE